MGRNDDNDEEYKGEKLVAPADFDGPTGDRHCTDIFCSLLLIASWAAMTALGIYAIQNGDYRVVLFPLDYDGNICGTNFAKDMTEFPFLWYINNFGGGVCVDRCPSFENFTLSSSEAEQEAQDDNNNTMSTNTTVNTTISMIMSSDTPAVLSDVRTLITYGGLWQAPDGLALLNDSFVKVGPYNESEDAIFCSEENCFPNGNEMQSWDSQGINRGFGYAYYVADSYPVLKRCFITDEAAEQVELLVGANTTLEAAENSYSFWNELYADLWTAKPYILGFGFGVAVLVSFIYIFFLRIPCLLNLVIWGSIFLSIGLFGASGYFAFRLANQWENENPVVQSNRTIQATRISSYVLWGIGGILFLLMCCLRKQIQLAIGCVKETGRAMQRMPGIVLVPILQAAGLIAFLGVFTIFAVCLASLGKITVREINLRNITDQQFATSLLNVDGAPQIAVRSFEFDDFVEQSAWYLLFCLYWTGNFIVAVGDMVVAMSFAKWYFSRDKSRIGTGTVWDSLYDTMWYHLGTCAFGSLILSLIQLIRSMLAKVQKEIKEKVNSKVADCLLCCCQCCLWCFEKCIKFLNKNAYIQTAIFGTSFCKSAREAFFLILRNVGRIGAITYVSGAILVVGKLFISVVTTSLSYYVIVEWAEADLNSVAGPIIFVFIISYFVSDMFMDIFEMGITTILQCFIADEEMFDGDECFAENELRSWIDNYED